MIEAAVFIAVAYLVGAAITFFAVDPPLLNKLVSALIWPSWPWWRGR